MKAQSAIRQNLLDFFARAKKKNARYSMRALAKKLDIHPSALSHVLSGKRIVSRKLGKKLMTAIGLDPQERAEVLALFPRHKKPAPIKNTEVKARYRKIDMTIFEKIFEWEYFTFIHLLRCTDFSSDREWIASRLGVSTAKVEEVIQNLVAAKMIVVRGRKIKNADNFRSSDDVAADTLKKFHEQNLELAKKSLCHHPIEKRDFTTVTFAVNSSRLPEAKEKIRLFQDELLDLISDQEANEVYRLSMELFPLTQLPKQGA